MRNLYEKSQKNAEELADVLKAVSSFCLSRKLFLSATC